MKFIKHLKLLQLLQQPRGFTLVELLVGAAISGVVIAVSGYGLVSVMTADKTALAQSERRIELNRALELISSEVKAASNIELDAAAAAATVSGLTIPSGGQAVLVLNVPTSTEKIIYYIAPAPTGSVWQGPNVLYRYGPSFNADGTYATAAPTSQILIDLIADTTPSGQACNNASWSLNPTTNRKGFYACVSPDGKVAEVHEVGKVTKAYQVNDSYAIDSQAYARNTPPGTTGTTTPPAFTLSGGVLTVPKNSNITFQRLGGAITCGSPGPDIPVTTKLFFNGETKATILNPITPLKRKAGKTTSVVVESTAAGNSSSGNCKSHNMTFQSNNTNTSNVLALRNGDKVPKFVPYGNQAKLDDYLKPILDPVSGKVKIGQNQVVYLFELGVTDTNSAAFDMQDNVVLATIDY